MNRIAIDVVLLPEPAMTTRAIEINADMVERCGSEIVLDAKTCLPHISVAMACIEQEALEPISVRLDALAQTHPVGELTVTGVVTSLNSRGEAVSVFAVGKTQPIQSLHERVMDTLAPYEGTEVSEAMIYGEGPVAPSTLAWIRTFRTKSAFAGYFPHITIGYGTVEQEMRFPMRFAASDLAICHLGNHCTCRQVLASAPLGTD